MMAVVQTAIKLVTPVFWLSLSIAAFTFAVSSPTKKHHLVQLASAAFTWLSFTSSGNLPDPWNNTWALMMGVWISHSTSLLWLEDVNKLQWPTTKERPNWMLWNNPRLIGTSRQVPGVKPAKQPYNLVTYTLVRLTRAAVFLIAYNNIWPIILSPYGIPVELENWNAEHTTYIHRLLPGHPMPLTLHETKIRCVWAVLWAMGPYITLTAAHDLFSVLLVVILGIDEPSDWPPLFGSITEAYNIRRFWGNFWHKIIVRPYANFGALFSRRVLRLPKGSRAESTCVAFSVFLISGATHAAVAWQLRDALWRLDVVWFVGCFAAGAVEEVFIRQVRGVFVAAGRKDLWESLKKNLLVKGLGFCWVFFFFFWSVPKWQYPKLQWAVKETLTRFVLA